VFTQWLGSTIFYLVYSAGGILGLKLFRAIFFLGVIAIFFKQAKKYVPYGLMLPIALAAALGLSSRCLLRPFIFNFIFVQLLLLILFDYLRAQHPRRLFLIPFLGILWSNLHLGSFVYGNLILFSFLLGEVVGYANKRIGKSEGGSRGNSRSLARLSLVIVAFNLSSLISPYGYKAFLYPYKVFFLSDFIHFYELNNVIGEQLAPKYLFTFKGVWFFFLFIIGIFGLVLDQRDKFVKILLFCFATFLFFRGSRAAGYFTIIAVYIILESFRSNSEKYSWEISKGLHFVLLVSIALFILDLSYQLLNQRSKEQGKITHYINIEYLPSNPRKALNFLSGNKITGVLLAPDSEGGYINWVAYPRLKSFVDGRQIDQNIFQLYRNILTEPSLFWPKACDRFQMHIVLLDLNRMRSFAFVNYIVGNPDWRLVFIDGFHVVFVKKGIFHLSQELQNYGGIIKNIPLTYENIDLLMNVMLTSPGESTISRYFLESEYDADLAKAITLYSLGYRGASVEELLRILQYGDSREAKDFAQFVINDLGRKLPQIPQAKIPNVKAVP